MHLSFSHSLAIPTFTLETLYFTQYLEGQSSLYDYIIKTNFHEVIQFFALLYSEFTSA